LATTLVFEDNAKNFVDIGGCAKIEQLLVVYTDQDGNCDQDIALQVENLVNVLMTHQDLAATVRANWTHKAFLPLIVGLEICRRSNGYCFPACSHNGALYPFSTKTNGGLLCSYPGCEKKIDPQKECTCASCSYAIGAPASIKVIGSARRSLFSPKGPMSFMSAKWDIPRFWYCNHCTTFDIPLCIKHHRPYLCEAGSIWVCDHNCPIKDALFAVCPCCEHELQLSSLYITDDLHQIFYSFFKRTNNTDDQRTNTGGRKSIINSNFLSPDSEGVQVKGLKVSKKGRRWSFPWCVSNEELQLWEQTTKSSS